MISGIFCHGMQGQWRALNKKWTTTARILVTNYDIACCETILKYFLNLLSFFLRPPISHSNRQSKAGLGRNSAALLHSGYEIIRSRKINMRYYQWQVLKFHSLVVGYKKSLSFYQQHSNINWKGCQSPTVGLSVSSNSIKAIYNAIIIQNSRITLVFYVKSFSDTS